MVVKKDRLLVIGMTCSEMKKSEHFPPDMALALQMVYFSLKSIKFFSSFLTPRFDLRQASLAHAVHRLLPNGGSN